MRKEFLRSIYDASTEILGRLEADNIFTSAVGCTGKDILDQQSLPSDFLSNLSAEFSIRFQQNTAKGLLIRIGDAAFSFLRKRISGLHDLGSIENRLKPLAKRFADSFEILAENLSGGFGMQINSSMIGEGMYCLEFGERDDLQSSGDLHLYFFGGILRVFGLWLDSRKDYAIDFGKTDSSSGKQRVCLLVRAAE